MDFKFGSLIFSSNFDSGNLLNVERVTLNEDNFNNHNNSQSEPIKMDYEFNIWTRPDCYGTQFENGNRTWFYFSVKGYLPGKMIRITIKNLNRQQRLYAQGYCPLFKTETINKDTDKWLRIRYRPTWENNETNFQLTFTHRLSDIKYSVTYFAFCYPWSYTDCQKQLEALDLKYDVVSNCGWDMLSKFDKRTIYYNRELLTKSLEGRRIDLLTISDFEGLRNEREDTFDEKLFPDKCNRPWKFRDKKVFIVTSRVHPGETPSSHVFNGFLNFILRPDDPRSMQLRKQYIFKLIPLLNPDGVYNGNYRTDSRGINLNRVYLSPDFTLHSPIYAAKSLLVYHHIVNSDEPTHKLFTIKSKVYSNDSGLDLVTIRDVSPHELTTPINHLDAQNKSISATRNLVSEVGDYQMPIIVRTSNFIPCESKELQFADSPSHIASKPVNDEYAPANKNPVSDNLIIEDCLEVAVDVDSLKYEFEPLNLFGKNPTYIRNHAKSSEERDDSVSEEQCMSLINDRERVQKQSIYRLFKPPNRSKTMAALGNKSRHQWNVKGNQANFLDFNDPLPKEVGQQAIKLHKKQRSSMIPLPLRPAIVSMRFASKTLNRGVSIDSGQLSNLTKELPPVCNNYKSEPKIGNEGSDDDSDLECYVGQNENRAASSHLCHPTLLDISADRSGIAFYVDLHGHCSKRGCFMYGNSLESDKCMNDNVLYPKLISLNSPNFDFFGCNFSLKNMYTKDKKDGTSKEGAGRVAIWKHLGLIHSYTLECNYNTGRTVNSVPPTSKDEGRASPVPTETSCSLPPKYTPSHFEDVGKAMAIASLDMTQTNPWSRIINSEYTTLQNVREYVRKFLNGQKNGLRPSISFRHRINRPVNKVAVNGITPLSKSLSNQLDNRRLNNGSQGAMSMSAPRKSQPFIMSHFTNDNANLIKPILYNGHAVNSNQANAEDDNVVMAIRRDSLNANMTDQHNGIMRTCISNISADLLNKPDSVRSNLKSQENSYRKLSCNSASIVTRTIIKEEMPKLVKTLPVAVKIIDMVESVSDNNRNNSAAKNPEACRRNSTSDCYIDESPYHLLEKEKLDELKEILSDEKCFRSISKTPTFNFETRSCQLKKKETSKKVLGKIISYSTNDINY